MKPLKTLALLPILAVAGFTAAQVAIPAAHGDDSVKVRASVLFNFDGGARGYVSFGEPFHNRIIRRVDEPRVVYLCPEPLMPVFIHEHARQGVIVTNVLWDNDRPDRGNKYGHKKQAHKVEVIKRNERGHERYIQETGQTVRFEDRNTRGDDRNTRGYARQIVESRKGKHGKND